MNNLPNFTVFDVETTGLDPHKGHKIIEIAGMRIEGGIIQQEKIFVELVNPERLIPWEARQVNKISDEAVEKAPTIDQILPKFLEFAKDSILVAHNAQFDMGFLEVEKETCWGYTELPQCLCTMRLSRALYPHEFRHNLDIVTARLGLEFPKDRHRALPDVLVTAQAFLKMIEEGGIASLGALQQKAGLRQMVA
ncbi:MAG: 3'-5' exonuclease [bacterium]|nr:3'-5' exonuclease [bacterium]